MSSPTPAVDVDVSTRPALRRALGLGFGVAVTVGTIIGTGILRTPGDVAAQLPRPALFFAAWIVGGLYALLGANSLTELGTMMPHSGGQYVYARHTFGPFAGFVVGWTDWISTCGTVAAVSIVFAEAAVWLLPSMTGHTVALAFVTISVLTAILWRGVSWGDGLQQLTSLIKALAIIALIIACFVLGSRYPTSHTASAVGRLDGGVGVPVLAAFVLAMQGVIFTYDGWTAPLYFSEEVRDPGRQLPRSVFGGLILVIAIYLLVNAAFTYVLPLDVIAKSQLAAATAADAVFGARGETVVRWIVVLVLPSAMNANLLNGSRIVFAMGRDGLTSSKAVQMNAGGTPTIALLATAVTAILFLATGTFETVIALLAFFFVFAYALSFAAVFVLRHREPNAPRPYRAWGYPWTTAIVLIGSLSFLVSAIVSDTRNSVFAILLLFLSYPAFILLKKRGIQAS